jgi:K+ transporter
MDEGGLEHISLAVFMVAVPLLGIFFFAGERIKVHELAVIGLVLFSIFVSIVLTGLYKKTKKLVEKMDSHEKQIESMNDCLEEFTNTVIELENKATRSKLVENMQDNQKDLSYGTEVRL